jgi:hypothetical protein
LKLVMTLLIRDEVDVLEAHLAFHLNAGVDLVIATDHRSTDGTAELLESHARQGYVHLIRRTDLRIQQSAWVTHMARFAASDLAADWVIHSDADEFWWPRNGSLKEALEAVPSRYGSVRAVSRVFVPRIGEGWFAERMTARLALAAALNDPATPYRHVAKVAHRGHPDAVVHQGNHTVSGLPWPELRGWSPIELLHFPLRSREQATGKHEKTWTAWRENLRGDLARAKDAFVQGGPGSFYDGIALDDATVERGLAQGVLVEDLRMRDALRRLRDGSGAFGRAATARTGLPARSSSASEDASRILDAVLLAEADIVRLQRRTDELAARVARCSGRAVYRYADS